MIAGGLPGDIPINKTAVSPVAIAQRPGWLGNIFFQLSANWVSGRRLQRRMFGPDDKKHF